jgi:hypothetical protein
MADRTAFCLPSDLVDCLGMYNTGAAIGVVQDVLSQLRSILLRTGLQCLTGATGCDPCPVVARFRLETAAGYGGWCRKGQGIPFEERLFIEVADMSIETEMEVGALLRELEVETEIDLVCK